jgi:hypothetical protein
MGGRLRFDEDQDLGKRAQNKFIKWSKFYQAINLPWMHSAKYLFHKASGVWHGTCVDPFSARLSFVQH